MPRRKRNVLFQSVDTFLSGRPDMSHVIAPCVVTAALLSLTSLSSAQTVSGNDLNTILLTGLNDFGFDEVVALEIFKQNGVDYGRTIYNTSKHPLPK